MHFGFSYVGLIYLVMLMVPNFIWARHKPEGYDEYVKNENRILLAFERAGEVLVSTAAVIFSDFNIHSLSFEPWDLWLAASFVLMILYELYWISYFRKHVKTMRAQYSSFAGFPIAGAALPVTAFFLLGVYGTNLILIISVIILGIGHLGIHLSHEKECSENAEKRSLLSEVLRWKWMIIAVLLPLILVIQVFAGRIGHSGIDADGSNALRYDYDADNLIGIKSAVLDGNTVTYIFAADACIFNRYDVTRALIRREVYACINNIPTSTPETVIYSKKNGDVYLTFYFADNDDMSRVDGFYLFLSEDKWITVNDPDGNIFVSCYEINSRGFHNIGSEYSFMYESGSKTSQIWNSNGSGKWSEVKTAHFGVDTMRRE